ncbi:MAG: hypothetical protein M9895_09600 [Aquamicrobium sp.]|uniref:hypothetical protein n=1 Tax=Aquamicrobium sp. TaxID=1872579 RepID=UPI00349EA740|nr:hypothetical protein [Aquamicrobium sp.]
MGTTSAQGRDKRLTPGLAVAAAAGAAALLASCGGLLLWRVQSSLLVPVLLLSPLVVAASAWLAARHAIRATLSPAIAMAERLAALDFSEDSKVEEYTDTRELVAALARARAGLAARNKTARAHAAVAKLMGAGIGRLAEGDFSARISVDLPAPYDAFGRDFNAAMERLEAEASALTTLREATAAQAGALEEAAARLGKRAEKLGARVETDLRIIDVLGKRDSAEALAIARHTMEGVGVAARRNAEAAGEFARLAEALRAPDGRADGEEDAAARADKEMAA